MMKNTKTKKYLLLKNLRTGFLSVIFLSGFFIITEFHSPDRSENPFCPGVRDIKIETDSWK
jgi:hypothetical protein